MSRRSSEGRVEGIKHTWLAVFTDATWKDEEDEWQSASPFTPTDHQVAATIASFMGVNGDSCFPSIARLSKGTKRSESTVRESLDRLVSFGFLERERGGGRGRSNHYAARIPEYFDWHAASAENLRRAEAFASGHEQMLVGPVAAPVPDAQIDAPEKPSGERSVSSLETPRSATLNPPERDIKPPAVRGGLTKDLSKDLSTLPPTAVGEGDRELELRLAFSVELGANPVTAAERKRWDWAIAQLVEVDATAAQVKARIAVWPFSGQWTPEAIARHWGMLEGLVAAGSGSGSLEGWLRKDGWRQDDEQITTILHDRHLDQAEQARLLELVTVIRNERAAEAAALLELDERREAAA